MGKLLHAGTYLQRAFILDPIFLCLFIFCQKSSSGCGKVEILRGRVRAPGEIPDELPDRDQLDGRVGFQAQESRGAGGCQGQGGLGEARGKFRTSSDPRRTSEICFSLAEFYSRLNLFSRKIVFLLYIFRYFNLNSHCARFFLFQLTLFISNSINLYIFVHKICFMSSI